MCAGLPPMYVCGEQIANELSYINDFRGSASSRPNAGYLQVIVNGWPGTRCTHTHKRARARTHTHTHSLSLSHTHARTHAHKHTNAQKRTHAHLKIRMFRRNVWHLSRSFSVWCSEKCAGVCVCVCVCACVRVCVCVNASHDNSVVGKHRARYRNPRRLRRFFLAGFVCQV